MGTNADDAGKLALRITLGVLMLFNGVAKLKDLSEIHAIVRDHGLPELLTYGVLVGEVLAPILLILGILTRAAGSTLAVNMSIAVLLKHTASILKLSRWGGVAIELELLYAMGGIAVALLGPGRFTLARRGAKRWWLE